MRLFNRLMNLAKPLVDRFPYIAVIYRNVRDQMDVGSKSITTPWGFTLAGNPLMARGDFEQTETDLVRDLLKDVDIFVNVGANIGYYCCHALSMGKQVVAFEPIPRNLRYLCRNISENGWVGAEIYPVALSDKADVLKIYGGDTGASLIRGWAGAPDSYSTLVPTLTMDSVLGEKLKGKKVLILIDVEGSEKSVLDGASTILANTPSPTWFVEISSGENYPTGVTENPNFIDTFAMFFDAGYKARGVGEKMVSVTSAEAPLILKGKSSYHGNNYLFVNEK